MKTYNFPKFIGDANEAVARVAHKINEVCAIYPITPSSPMGEHADALSAKGSKNIWGQVPRIIEMQSEGGAAGAVHGSLQGGALTTTFTASQGLLLMIPNMYKIAGELLPTVFHIAARTVATHALSIFGDHSDVMATRQTGWAMLFGGSVQEAQDFALLAQVASLKSRVPFLNVFDGFRTSHEIQKIDAITDEIYKEMMPEDDILAFKQRALDPDAPKLRGSSQNPDVFFQNRERANPFYLRVPDIMQETFDKFYELTGRRYNLFDYYGHPEAERIIVLMGSGTGAVRETVDELVKQGEKVGAVFVRLYRPFSVKHFIDAVPESVKKIAVLDRTKEPGAIGEPLYMDVVNAFAESDRDFPTIVGGRYGLSSKEFNPPMVKGVFDELKKDKPKNHFTVGIIDDVTYTNLDPDKDFKVRTNTKNFMFFGLGSDGTVSANKNSIKIIGETTDYYVQGYFVYDSKKAGARTISHLRFGPDPIYSTYLIDEAEFVAVHQFDFIQKFNLADKAKEGGVFLLNSPYDKDEIWAQLPVKVQETIIKKKLEFYVIDASRVAYEAKLGRRINTVLQTAFFAISGILPQDEAIKRIKDAIVKSYSHKGDHIVQMNFNAVDTALKYLQKVDYPDHTVGNKDFEPVMDPRAPEYVKNVLGKIYAGEGDSLPVSVFEPDGTFPTGTAKYERQNIADFIPVWDDVNLCTQCNKCVEICPHAAIRAKIVKAEDLEGAPEGFRSAPLKGRYEGVDTYVLQVDPVHCTGCQLCVAVCPAESKEVEGFKSINMHPRLEVQEREEPYWEFFDSLPWYDRKKLKLTTVKNVQFLQPLFEYSGACPGCGETPYIKTITQLYGDSTLIANATGCSSIYGGNLPTTPYTYNDMGLGPAWANSLFEDNAEYGLGMRLALNAKQKEAFELLHELEDIVGSDLVDAIVNNPEHTEEEKEQQIQNVKAVRAALAGLTDPKARRLNVLADYLRKKYVWIIGGDGWAYDIGYGGLDHALASGEDINVLVLDTEVYSNTGGQASKATPLGAAAKFAISGKSTPKKDLALQAIAYGNVYVAQIAMGAKEQQALRAIREAAEYPGPSMIIAYSHCIEHGYGMEDGAYHQELAVKSGYWPLFRYNPSKPAGKRFSLDSKGPEIPVSEFMYKEARFARLIKQNPENAQKLLEMAQEEINARWERLQIFANL
ncbi:MAG: pyruvate:ferredoxin (flavodoxin) oxidoreductase [Chlorobi bacterium]|nr:pyruvate:ferredoxin (flavodoxin) oxidoreductase [Chlorobiota bacterium]